MSSTGQIGLISQLFCHGDTKKTIEVKSLEFSCNNDLRMVTEGAKVTRYLLILKNLIVCFTTFIQTLDLHSHQWLCFKTITWDQITENDNNWNTRMGQSCRAYLNKIHNHGQPITALWAFLNSRSATVLSVYLLSFNIWRTHSQLSRTKIRFSLFSPQKCVFKIIANIQHVPFHLIPTAELSASLKLITLPFNQAFLLCEWMDT